jgi:hypothetical protein
MIPKSVTEPEGFRLRLGGGDGGLQYQTILIRRDGTPIKPQLFPGF